MEKVFAVPFKNYGRHECEVSVCCCEDWRFILLTMVEFILKELKIEEFDLVSVAGAAKTINDGETLTDFCLRVSSDLHHVKKFVIINHSDCGAYGGLKKFNGDKTLEEAFHRQELLKAKTKLMEQFPDKEILSFFIRLSKDNTQAEFVEV